jgi:hypothetical protein
MRNALLVISHVLRFGGTLIASLGGFVLVTWVLDESAGAGLLATAAVLIGAGGAALWGGGSLSQSAKQRSTKDATARTVGSG